MPAPPLVALDLGTSRVRALVGEPRDDGHLMITGIGEHRSLGIRKGEVTDFDNALACVRSALQDAEEQADVDIRSVLLAFSGGRVRSEVNRGTVHVLNPGGEITPREMQSVAVAAKTVTLPPERLVVHTIQQRYHVDGQEGVTNPAGMEARQLSLDMLVVHGRESLLHNLVRVVRSANVDVEDAAFGGLCSALAVLTREQKRNGALLVDLGGGTTNYLAYARQCVAAAGSISVGGDHVTNDLALGLRIPTTQAERLKLQHAAAVPVPEAQYQSISLPAEGGFPGRTIRLADVHAIAHARLDETLEMVKAEVDRLDLLHHFGAGVVLTGHGALVARVGDLVERVFRLPCTIGKPRDVSGLAVVTGGPEYAAAVGMLRYGQSTTQRGGGAGNLLDRLFGIIRGGGGSGS